MMCYARWFMRAGCIEFVRLSVNMLSDLDCTILALRYVLCIGWAANMRAALHDVLCTSPHSVPYVCR
jgi:hypothetical protein